MGLSILKFSAFPVLLIGSPLLGVFLAGYPVGRYLEFPPRTRFIPKMAFSWPVFVSLCLILFFTLYPLIKHGFQSYRPAAVTRSKQYAFPWWGTLGLGMGSIFWVLAWTRFHWFSLFQAHTFAPLWLCYILVINALTCRRAGSCIILRRPLRFLSLFPVSAGFWWFFEYLNRFVQNWYYVEEHYSPWQYGLLASVSFSTVIPAVISTREWLLSHDRFKKGFQTFIRIRPGYPGTMALATLGISTGGLLAIGLLPDFIFPLIWVAPLLMIVSLQALTNRPHILSDIRMGDWSLVVSSALAALICGFFWEMWNFCSLAKWHYDIPWVHRFLIFEMPILGYAGYLPFGLECAAVYQLVLNKGHLD